MVQRDGVNVVVLGSRWLGYFTVAQVDIALEESRCRILVKNRHEQSEEQAMENIHTES